MNKKDAIEAIARIKTRIKSIDSRIYARTCASWKFVLFFNVVAVGIFVLVVVMLNWLT